MTSTIYSPEILGPDILRWQALGIIQKSWDLQRHCKAKHKGNAKDFPGGTKRNAKGILRILKQYQSKKWNAKDFRQIQSKCKGNGKAFSATYKVKYKGNDKDFWG